MDWVLVVVKALASLPRKIQNIFFGGIINESIVEAGLNKAQSALRGKFAIPTDYQYADAIVRQGMAKGLPSPFRTQGERYTQNISTQGSDFSRDYENLMRESNKLQSDSNSSLKDLKDIFSKGTTYGSPTG